MTNMDVYLDRIAGDDGRSHWQLGVFGRRIPSQYVIQWQHIQSLVEKSEMIVQEALQQADDIRTQAYLEGFNAGKKQVALENIDNALAIQSQADQWLADNEPKLLQLAILLVKKILPSLPEHNLVESMLHTGLQAIDAERSVTIRIASKYLETMETLVKHKFSENRSPIKVEVVNDISLNELECVIESDLCVVRCGLLDQIRQIEIQLLTTLEEGSDDESVTG